MNLYQKYNYLKLALKYPKISLKKIQHFIEGRISKKNEFPELLKFFLFHGCNLRCKMCGQWGISGISKSREIKKYLSIEKLNSLIDEAAPFKPEIYIWGGEPTLHPNFTDFLFYIKQKDLTCTINTNGILLKKYADKILQLRIDSLDVSLIGTKNIHDSVVQKPGSFEKVMEGLDIIYQKHKKYNYKPLIKIITTLNDENLDNIEELLESLEKNPAVDIVIIQLGWFTTEKTGEVYEKRMKKDFNVEAKSWKGFLDEEVWRRAAKSQILIEKIRENNSYKKPVLVFPNLKTQYIAEYYQKHNAFFNHRICAALNRELDVRYNGDVVVCSDYPDLILGNINSQSLKKIWQGENITKLRKCTLDHGLMSVCSRCCGLFR